MKVLYAMCFVFSVFFFLSCCTSHGDSFLPTPELGVSLVDSVTPSQPHHVVAVASLLVIADMEMDLSIEQWVDGEKIQEYTMHVSVPSAPLTLRWGPGEYRLMGRSMGYHTVRISRNVDDEDVIVEFPELLPYETVIPEGYVYSGEQGSRVWVDAFRIDTMEVSFGEYQFCVNWGDCEELESMSDAKFFDPEKPVVGANWFDALAYCRWQGKWLPTLLQWERAARGDDERPYPWGDKKFHQPANYINASRNDGYVYTAPADSFREGASPFGVLNMAGNVYEWVGNVNAGMRELKGGSWNSSSKSIQIWMTRTEVPEKRKKEFGFRCAGGV